MTYQTTIEANGSDVAYATADSEKESISKAVRMFENLCQTDKNIRKAGISLIRTEEVSV